MPIHDADVLEIVRRFNEMAHHAASQIIAHYGVANLPDGRKSRTIPKNGRVGDELEFEFHGKGCRIQVGPLTVDFDFLPDSSPGGFDAWRLHWFIEENRLVPNPPEPDELRPILERLAMTGAIQQVGTTNLFQLA